MTDSPTSASSSGAGDGAAPPILRIDCLSKTFAGQVALNRASLELRAGEIHGLIGHNGSGKSTLIKILDGYHEPDPDSVVTYEGAQLDNVHDLVHRGRLRTMHQDLGLILSQSVMENLALGRGYETNALGGIAWRRERRKARELLQEYQLTTDPRSPISSMSSAERALVGFIRAREGWDPVNGIFILDEPTASMPAEETKLLFDAVRSLAAQGAAVLFVSHRLDEVVELCQSVTVLRNGRVAYSGESGHLDVARMTELILGPAADEQPDHKDAGAPARSHAGGDVEVRVQGLCGAVLRDLSFDVRSGEVVGIGGLVGSGRDEVAPLVVGSAKRVAGTLTVGGRKVPADPAAALRLGVVGVPADRKTRALFGRSSVADNITLNSLPRIGRPWWLGNRAVRRVAEDAVRRMDVKPQDTRTEAGVLSGGNQQKVAIARALGARPRLLVLEEPTQGVDVGAKEAIYAVVRMVVAEGCAVLVCSSDEAELAALCDRVIVLGRGTAVAELQGAELNRHAIEHIALVSG